MTRKLRKRQWKGPLPTSGEVIGVLAGIFDWKPRHSAKDRTWRKFTHGEPIHADTRKAILEEIASLFFHEVGEIRTPAGMVISREEAMEAHLHALVTHASWWDEICERLRAEVPIAPTGFSTRVTLRLVAVELAVRISALCVVWEVRPPLPVSQWKVDVQLQALLSGQLRQTLKHLKLSRRALAEELGVTKEAVDQWLAPGAIVGVRLLDDIAEVIAEKSGQNEAQVRALLRLMRVLSRVLKGLYDLVGKEELDRVISALLRLVGAAVPALWKLLEGQPGRIREMILGNLVGLGSESFLGQQLREAMLEQEQDDSWRGVISAPPPMWEQFLGNALLAEKSIEEARRIHAREGFKYIAITEEQVSFRHRLVLLPEDRLDPVSAMIKTLPKHESLELRLQLFLTCIQWMHSDETGPEVWRDLIKCAEVCRFQMLNSEGEAQAKWACLSWMSYAACIGRIADGGEQASERLDHHEELRWGEYLDEVLQALPPLPENAEPEVQPFIDALRQVASEWKRLGGLTGLRSNQDGAHLLDRQTAVLS